MKNRYIFEMQSNDILENLSFEEVLLRRSANSLDEYSLIYKNFPCVVMGKNQVSIWEVDLEYLRENNIQFCRRISGGGTIYNDLDCLNISFILNKKNYSAQKVTQKVMQILSLIFNSNNFSSTDKSDILFMDKKISGSAFYHYKNKILHHMTLLVDSDLEKLKKSLNGLRKFSNFSLIGGFINSREKETTNLKSHFQIKTSDLKEKLLFAIENDFDFKKIDFKKIYKSLEEKEIKTCIEKHKSFSYTYARSDFSIKIDQSLLDFEDGYCKKNNGKVIFDTLIGQRIDKIDFKNINSRL